MRDDEIQLMNNGNQSNARPVSVSLLVVLVLFFSATNIIKLVNALSSWDFLTALLPDVPLLYLAVSGAVWSISGIILALLLFSGRKSAVIPSRVISLLYPIIYWVDRLLIADNFFNHQRWWFDLALTILLIVFLYWVLERKHTKDFLIQ